MCRYKFVYISFFLVPPRLVSYSPKEPSISYSEGSSMNLTCHGFAIPSANVTWIFKDMNKQSKGKLTRTSVFIYLKRQNKNVFSNS